jgi:hypothetical protein
LALHFFVWNALTAIELAEPFLNSRQELHPLSNVVERGLVGQLANSIQHKFFLRHSGSIDFEMRASKRLIASQIERESVNVAIRREFVRVQAENRGHLFPLFHLDPVRDQIGIEARDACRTSGVVSKMILKRVATSLIRAGGAAPLVSLAVTTGF